MDEADELARRFLALWSDYLTALLSEPNAAEPLRRMIQAVAPPDIAASDRADAAADRSPAAAAAAAGTSGERDAVVDELSRRIDELEARLARLEQHRARSAARRGGARRRDRPGRD